MTYLLTIFLCWLLVYRRPAMQAKKIQSVPTVNLSKRRQLLWSIAYLIFVSLLNTFLLYLALRGWTRIYLDFQAYSPLYFVFSILLYLLGFEFYFYLTHRLLHTRFLYRAVHFVHHKVHAPSAHSIFCLHPLEGLIFFIYHIFLACLIPLHPIAIITTNLVIHQGNVFGHMGYEVFTQKFRQRFPFLNYPSFHDKHHQFQSCNYGFFFVLLDRFLKTEK